VHSWTIIDSPPNEDCRPIKFVQDAQNVGSLKFSPGQHFSPEDLAGEEAWGRLGQKFGWPFSDCEHANKTKYLTESKGIVYAAGLWETMKFNDMLVYDPEVMEEINRHPPEDLAERSALAIADVIFGKTYTKEMPWSDKRSDIEAFQALRVMSEHDRPADTLEIVDRLLSVATEKDLAARKWFGREAIKRLGERAISIEPSTMRQPPKPR
jgi:hypothetical protein